jgi:hypothetical protein
MAGHPARVAGRPTRLPNVLNKKRPGVSTGPFRLPRLRAIQTGIQFGFMRPSPLQRGQSGSESLTPLLGCGRTALPVPPQAWQNSRTTTGLGFFKITFADPSFLRTKCERDRGAVGHGERKPERDAVAFSLARAFSRIRVTDFLNGPKKSQKFPELHTGSRDGSSAHAAPISFDRRCHVFRRKFYRSSSGQERWRIVCSERANRIALVLRSGARTEVDAVRTSVTIVIFAAVFQPLDSTGTFQVLPARKIQPFLRPRIQKKDPPWPIRSTKPPFPS